MRPRHTFVASGLAEHLERLPLLMLLSVYAVPMGTILLDFSLGDRIAVVAFVVAIGAWLAQRHREVVVGRDGVLVRSAFFRLETFVPYDDLVEVRHEQRLWTAGPGVVRLRFHEHRPEAFVFGTLYAAAGNTPEAMVTAVERARRAYGAQLVPTAVAEVHAAGDTFEDWFDAHRRALAMGTHRRAGVSLPELWGMVLAAPTTPLQRALVAWVTLEEGLILAAPSLAEVARDTAHPLAAHTFHALARGDFTAAREGLESLWCDEGCGDAVAVSPAT